MPKHITKKNYGERGLDKKYKAVIFDFGDVLVNIERLAGASTETKVSGLLYKLLTRNGSKELIHALTSITNEGTKDIQQSKHRVGVSNPPMLKNIVPLPEILCQQQENRRADGSELSTYEVYDIVTNAIRKHYATKHSRFNIARMCEKNILLGLCDVSIDPDGLTTTVNLLTPAIELAQELKRKGIPIAACTNCELVALKKMLVRFPELRELFDATVDESGNVTSLGTIASSGDTGYAKPAHGIFDYLRDKILTPRGLEPNECLFVDDQIENIEAGQACDFGGIHYPNKDTEQLRQILVDVGLL